MTEDAGTFRSDRAGAQGACPASFRGLLALAALLIGAACGRGVSGTGAHLSETIAAAAPRTVDVYYPLTPKSRWTYRIEDFGRKWTYKNTVQVHGSRFVDEVQRGGIEVEERYSSTSGPYFVEEQEPILYYRENGYLNRIFLTYQGRKLVAASGSGDTAFLPELLEAGRKWSTDTKAFQLGGGLGLSVAHEHVVLAEPEVVRVPAGEFRQCLRVDTRSSQGPNSGKEPGGELLFFYSDWYAPGVGLVKTEQWEDQKRSRVHARIELLEYAVSPQSGPTDSTVR